MSPPGAVAVRVNAWPLWCWAAALPVHSQSVLEFVQEPHLRHSEDALSQPRPLGAVMASNRKQAPNLKI